jgi:RNA polymerase sigma-70 factor (ECF subfamily)
MATMTVGVAMPAITESSNQAVAPAVRELGLARDRSDEVLVRAIAGGDRSAMQALYGRHHVRVYRFVLRLTNNVSLAEDLVSEVFFDVWRQGASFEGRSQVSTWILAIARNKALSALRRRQDEQLDDEVANSVEDPADNAQTRIEIQDRDAIIRRCLSQLSRDHREVIDLVYYHEKSVDEVAEIIQVPRNTVKTRMFYARKCLGKLLKASGYFDDGIGAIGSAS